VIRIDNEFAYSFFPDDFNPTDGIEAIDKWLAMLRKALSANYERLDAVLANLEPPKTTKRAKDKR
jgi:hypothetical protein